MRPLPFALDSVRPKLARGLLVALVWGTFGGTTRARETEQDLLAILQSDAGPVDKANACRALRTRGTLTAIPLLSTLLSDERLGHAARDALDGLPFPEATESLRRAIPRTTGLIRAGLIDSLGRRGETRDVPMLAGFLTGPDPDAATAAAGALGRIAGAEGVGVLWEAVDLEQPGLRGLIVDGLLHAAESFLRSGDTEAASLVYRHLGERSLPAHTTGAVWRGRVNCASPEQAAASIALALSAPATPEGAMAIRLIQETRDPAVIHACLNRWPDLAPRAQAALPAAVARLGMDAPATLSAASRSEDPDVRTAAWTAAAEMTVPSLVSDLAAAVARGEPPEAEAARNALARMHGPGVFEGIVTALDMAGPKKAVALLRALGARGDPGAPTILLNAAKASNPESRRAAWRALEDLADPTSLEALLRLAAEAEAGPDVQAATRAVVAAVRADPDPHRATQRVLREWTHRPGGPQRQWMPVLAELATPEALAALESAARHPDAAVAQKALQWLGRWPNIEPAAGLLRVGQDTDDPIRRTLALRSLLSIIERVPDPEGRWAWLEDALPLAADPPERRMLLARLAETPHPDALAATLPLLRDPAVAGEAALAAVGMASALAEIHPALARRAAREVLAADADPAVAIQARTLLRPAIQPGPFIRHWLVAGPYRQTGVLGAESVFDLVFGPEAGDPEVAWYSVPEGDHVNLAGLFPGQDHCLAYVRAEIQAPEDADGFLLMGSDDGIQAWWNGAVVFRNNVDRGMITDQDGAPIRIVAGKNDLLLKVSQGAGGWSACARIVGESGHPLGGLSARPLTGNPVPAPSPQPDPAEPDAVVASELPPRDPFRTLRLEDTFLAEGAAVADMNRDRAPDVIAGPYWYAGPTFESRHRYRPGEPFDPNGYSDNFLTFTDDLDQDGWDDILCAPFPGAEAYWYRNPGKAGNWTRHLAHPSVGNESPAWGDLTGDGRPELVFCIDGFLGYAGPDPARPDRPWTFQAISEKNDRYQRFTHGLGLGDINGDGRTDVVEAAGWWEQEAAANGGDAPGWRFHPARFADAAAQLLITDVNGDGLADIITAWHCHLYGLVWWEQIPGPDPAVTWARRIILPPAPDTQSPAFRVSQLHALTLVDMNGDGVEDILTGKRFWAHGPSGDKEPNAPAIVFWLEISRTDGQPPHFIPHLIHDDSGVGTQVCAGDLNDDRKPDVLVANKKGVFVHLSRVD